MRPRPSSCFMSFLAGAMLVCLALGLHARSSQHARLPELQEQTRLVRYLRLTDLCLFTEARYTRHPAMADYFAAFQDHPTAFEHFPSGSLVQPPVTLQRTYAPHP